MVAAPAAFRETVAALALENLVFVDESGIATDLLRLYGRAPVVLMDNLSPHKAPRVRELIEGAGCQLLFLPPYSPDFNPIEQACSALRHGGSAQAAKAPTLQPVLNTKPSTGHSRRGAASATVVTPLLFAY